MSIIPTRITKDDQIYLAGSPIHLNINNINRDSEIKSALIFLYIWEGKLNEPPTLPTYTLSQSKISSSDNYISFQISELISSRINKTRLVYIAGDNKPTTSGEGVFFQVKYQVTQNNGNTEPLTTLESNFATNGYRYDYEQIGDVLNGGYDQPYLNLKPINYNRNYSSKIKYFKRSFDFTKTLAQCTSENIIKSEALTPSKTKCQLGNKAAIYYINRLGLWDCFTPFGKVTNSNKVKANTTPRLFRNPRSINNRVVHSSERVINNVEQSFKINTGALTELMVDQVEEVIYSPLLYIIEFSGITFESEEVGVTVDTTLITSDSTLFTADNIQVTEGDVGLYSEFKQIPVTNNNNSFVLKTRLNNKEKINYDLDFLATTDKINNVR